MDQTRPGDLVLFVAKDYKRFIVRLKPGGRLETHKGVIHHDDVIGQPLGREFDSHLGHPLLALPPSIYDLVKDIKRSSQIVFPKDTGYLLMRLDIHPGVRVIDAGTGSGAFALAVAHYVMPTGRMYSYDIRDDMLKLAERNLEAVGMSEYVELKCRDIGEGFDETDVDVVFLDVRTPWLYLDQAWKALKGGGFFGAILPTTNQVVALLRYLPQHGFGYVEVEETLVRSYKAVPARFRPMDRMIAHTGYLVLARKMDKTVLADVGDSSNGEDASFEFEDAE